MGLPSSFCTSLFLAVTFLSPLFVRFSLGLKPSFISFSFCDDFTGAFDFTIDVYGSYYRNPHNYAVVQPDRESVKFRGRGVRSYEQSLGAEILQSNVTYISVGQSSREICIEALVVDTIIIVDQPTIFKATCTSRDRANPIRPCKELNSHVQPVPICPEALTTLLKERQVIPRDAQIEKTGPQDFKVPEYNTINDLGQASSAIVDGLTDLSRKVLKSVANNFKKAAGTTLKEIGKTLGTFSNFLKAMGPVASIFSGILSIVTTFLTPNPWDEMAKYLEKEFDEVHRRLSHIQSDIADLKRVVQHENKVCGIGRKLEAIRYSLRRYKKMVKGLSRNKVCGANNLLNRTEVKDFMEQYKEQYVDDSLLDLYGVEYGEVLEASSLLKPLMRAYCLTDPNKVQKFMEDISNYAYAGSLAHDAFESLKCRQEGRRDCEDQSDEEKEEKHEWMMKVYNFLTKANAIKEAASNPAYGLQLDLKHDLNSTIYKYLEEAGSYSNRWDLYYSRDLLYAVDNQITNKLDDIKDWPEACMVNLDEKAIAVYVAQLKENVTDYANADYVPWDLPTGIELRYTNHHVRTGKHGYKKKYFNDGDAKFSCSHVTYACDVSFWRDPTRDMPHPNGYVISFLFSPRSYHIKGYMDDFKSFPYFEEIERKDVTPEVVVKRIPIYVFHVTYKYWKEKVSLAGSVFLATRKRRHSRDYFAFIPDFS